MSGAGFIPEGIRNVTLTSYAGSLRAHGASAQDLLQALRETNRLQCDPPLPDGEVRSIAASIARKPPHPTGRRDKAQLPRGCFEPRPAVCGLDAAAIIAEDTSLRLKRRHKLLFGLLQDHYGPLGCHPAQSTLAAALLTTRQQIARDVRRLVRAGLILVEAGARQKTGATYPCNSYHFRKHVLFRAHFGTSISSGFSEMRENAQQFFSSDEPEKTVHATFFQNQRVTGKRAPRVAPVTNIVAGSGDGGGAVAGRKGPAPFVCETDTAPKRSRAEIEPFVFETAPGYCAIVQYLECAARCGGARIVYSDGTVKRYECSCEIGQAEMAA